MLERVARHGTEVAEGSPYLELHQSVADDFEQFVEVLGDVQGWRREGPSDLQLLQTLQLSNAHHVVHFEQVETERFQFGKAFAEQIEQQIVDEGAFERLERR